MSNKLRKKIKCCLCEKEVPLTKDCQKLFDSYDVCPDCTRRLVGFVGRLINDADKEEDHENE